MMIRFMGNDVFELEIEGKPFSVAWQKVKQNKEFDWDTKDNKHDPYDVRSFGDQIPTYSSTKDISGTYGSSMHEEELEQEREKFDFEKYEKQVKKTKVQQAENEKLESGFDSVFD